MADALIASVSYRLKVPLHTPNLEYYEILLGGLTLSITRQHSVSYLILLRRALEALEPVFIRARFLGVVCG